MSIPLILPYLIKSKSLELPDKPLSEFWIVFTSSKDWLGYYLRRNFSHCYVLTRDKYNWIVLNPERLYLRAEIAPINAHDNLIDVIYTGRESVIKLAFKPRNTTIRFGIFGLFSCVMMVKYLCGLKIKAVTPWGLYKKLLNLSPSEMLKHRIESIELVKKEI